MPTKLKRGGTRHPTAEVRAALHDAFGRASLAVWDDIKDHLTPAEDAAHDGKTDTQFLHMIGMLGPLNPDFPIAITPALRANALGNISHHYPMLLSALRRRGWLFGDPRTRPSSPVRLGDPDEDYGRGRGRKRGGGFDDVFGTRPGSVPVQVTNDPVQMAKWEAEGNVALAARQAAAQAAIQQKLDNEKREGWKQTFGIMGDVFNSVGGLTKLIPGAGAVLSPIANTIGNLYKLGSGRSGGMGHSDCPCRGGAKEHSAFLRQLRKAGIEPKIYLSKAKSKAKKEGYDPATL